MSRRTSEDLVQELASDLRPVRPISSLRVAALKVLVLWLAAVGVSASLPADPLRFQVGLPWDELLHWSVLVGLAALAGGALLAAFAGVVPGRDRAAALGRAVAALGVVAVIGSGLWGIVGSRAAPLGPLLEGGSVCFAYAVALGLPSLWIATSFLSRGVAANPRIASGVAAAGVTGLGAFAVHASCPETGGYHVLLSHCLTPLIAAGLLALPLAAWVARGSRVESGSRHARS